MCFFLLLLVGLMRETWIHWLTVPQAMVADERRRIARDLHDGLAQELAYVTRHLAALDGSVEQETLSCLRRATERARLEARLEVSRLAVSDRPLAEELADAVGESAKQYGVDLELDLVPDVRLPEARADALVRIACEAVTNAGRHSGAGQVSVSLQRQGSRVRLRVSDYGSGFDPGTPAAGFGLTSMRERARLRGG